MGYTEPTRPGVSGFGEHQKRDEEERWRENLDQRMPDALWRDVLYLAQTDGPRYATLFSNEADGAFDAQHKRRFMAMKREVLRVGGYSQEYFISHTTELSEMADAVIDLERYAT
jgi:hypothetical protein